MEFTACALEAFGFLEGLGFVAGIDSGSRVHFESERVRVVVVHDGGKLEVLLVRKTSAGPHSPTYHLGELLRAKGLPVPSREVPSEGLAAQVAAAAECLRAYGQAALAADAAAYDALEEARRAHGHLYAEEQHQRAAEALNRYARHAALGGD